MSPRGQHRKSRILVVEDNPADVHLVRLALDGAGVDFELKVLDNGGAALAYVRAPAPRDIPDLVVLDLNLPKNDGIEILEAMRANPDFGTVPVVILTSSRSPHERARVEALNIARQIIKPLELGEFIAIGPILKEILETERTGRPHCSGWHA